MTKFCWNEPFYMLLAQKLIEDDVLKVDMLKKKHFHVYRNFWCQILAKIGGNESFKNGFYASIQIFMPSELTKQSETTQRMLR